jgi:hypothetical protein
MTLVTILDNAVGVSARTWTIYTNPHSMRPTPHPVLLPQGEKGRSNYRVRLGQGTDPSPHPHPLADAVSQSCKLSKASLPGEGQG